MIRTDSSQQMGAVLTVAVLHHRHPEVLARCLQLLSRHAPGVRIVVIDTSGDAALAGEWPAVEIRKLENVGMAHAANAGLRLAETPFVAHMNADVFVEAATFPKLLATLTQPGVGLVGPVGRSPDGRQQSLGPLYRAHYLRLRLSHAGSVAVPWLSGCLQVVRREALARVGGLDASFRFYNEDIEWCWRLRRGGFTCRLVATEVTHLGGASTPQHPAFLIEGYRGGMRLSRRTMAPWYRRAHRLAVMLEAGARGRLARRPERRASYRRIAAMFAERDYETSPFGATLDDRS